MRFQANLWTLTSSALLALSTPGLAAGATQHGLTKDGGRTLVVNPGAGPGEPGIHWRLVDEFRLGDILGDGPNSFGDISDIAVDRDGRIFVLDVGAREVRAFDGRGRYLRRMAGNGQGPGELIYFPMAAGPNDGMHIVWHPPNRVWVGSWLQHLVLDSLGNEVGRASLRPVSGGNTRSQVMRADAEFAYYEVTRGQAVTSGDLEYDRNTHVVRFPRAQGETVLADGDTIWIETRHVTVSLPEMRSVPGRGQLAVSVSKASPEQIAWTVGNGNVWLAHRSAYRFHEVTFGGDTIRTVELGNPPPPPPPPEAAHSAEFDPRIASLHVSPEGWLWVTREGHEDEATTWDLFDNCGLYRGAVAAPDGHRLWAVHVIDEGTVYGVVSDALDLDYVLRLQLEGRDGTRVKEETCPVRPAVRRPLGWSSGVGACVP